MKMAKILKTEGGKWSWRRISAALMVPVTMFFLSQAWGEYKWMRDQCYKVATTEMALVQTGENLKAKDISLDKKIDKLEADMKKGDGILHGRVSTEVDKRERGDERLLNLILDMLDNQQRNIQHQQDQLEQKAK